MSIYDGVVTLAEDDVPVVIELDNGHVRLSASGKEIGDWGADECEINLVADSTYTISVENETLRFVPRQPTLFAAALDDGGERLIEVPALVESNTDTSVSTSGSDDAPPPKPLTVGLFYALCVVTGAGAVWALVEMIL